MLWIFFFVISTFVSSGFGDPSHGNNFMNEPKPILRMGVSEEDDDPEHKELLKEPNWVKNLRFAIDEQVSKLGLRNAGGKIRQIISDVADDMKDIDIQGNEEPDPIEFEGKKGLRTLAEADEKRNPDKAEAAGDPLWITDLKSYVRELISSKGREDLESYIRPVINSVEKTNHVKIKDIDVNPYEFCWIYCCDYCLGGAKLKIPSGWFECCIEQLFQSFGEIFVNYEYVQKAKKSMRTKSNKSGAHPRNYRRRHYFQYI